MPAPTLGRGVAGVLAGAGALALVAATALDVVVVSAGPRTLATDTGLERHSVGLVLLAVAAIVLAVLAVRGARLAALGLALVGAVTILLVVLGDVPDLGRTGAYEELGLSATTEAGSGFYAESAGGILLLLAGGWLLLAPTTKNTR